jgi:hypothetical protein
MSGRTGHAKKNSTCCCWVGVWRGGGALADEVRRVAGWLGCCSLALVDDEDDDADNQAQEDLYKAPHRVGTGKHEATQEA